MSACPSINCTERKSAPRSSRCVAKLCRSLCGDRRVRMPARLPHVGQDSPDPDPADPAATAVDKEKRRRRSPLPASLEKRRAAGLQVLLDRRHGLAPDRHQPLLITLPDAAQAAHAHVQVEHAKRRPTRRRATQWNRAPRSSLGRVGHRAWRHRAAPTSGPPPPCADT